MRRTALVALAVSLLLGGALALAGEAKVSTLNGKVVAVDAKANTVMVQVEGAQGESSDMSFAVGPDTKILKDSEPISLADLHEGSKITVSFRNENGKNRALAINVASKA